MTATHAFMHVYLHVRYMYMYMCLQVLSEDTICHTLSLMHSCGMYDSAGEFSFAVSLLVLPMQWPISFPPPSPLSSPPPLPLLLSPIPQVGMPAKSGISGVIFVVIPNVMGICLYSPLVNRNGNSLKGLHFCQVGRCEGRGV